MIAVVTIALSAAGAIRAEEPAPKDGWKLDAGLSYLSTTGNSSTSSVGMNVDWERVAGDWRWQSGASALRAEEDGNTTAENYAAWGRASHVLSSRLSATGGLHGERNEFAGIDLRSVVDLGLSFKAVERPRWTVDTTGSATWTNEDRVGNDGSDSFLGVLLAGRSEVKLSDHAATVQELRIEPNLDDTNDYRIDAKVSLESALTDVLALKVGYQLRYDNVPVSGFRKTDTQTTASIVVRTGRGKFAKR